MKTAILILLAVAVGACAPATEARSTTETKEERSTTMKLRDIVRFHPGPALEFTQPVTIKNPTGSVQLSPGIRFMRGVSFLGVDYDWIVAHLDDLIAA